MRALILSLLWTTVGVSTASATTLTQALAQHDWDGSLLLAQHMEGPAIERQALPFAQRDLVPAMWLMGQARFLQQDLVGASRWFYRGWLGLQVDLSLCRMARSRAIAGVLMASFPEALSQVRGNVAVRTVGIREAAGYYAGRLDRDPEPGWSCSWAEQHTHPLHAQPGLLVGTDRYDALRARAFKTFLQSTGTGPIQAPPTGPTDPTTMVLP